MKKVLFIEMCLMALSILLTQCGRSDTECSIQGSFKRPVRIETNLGIMGIESVTIVDSAKTNASGEFILKGSCQHPSMFILNYYDENVYLILKPGDEITIEIDNSINPPSYYVSGSSDSRLVREITFEQQKVLNKITQISLAYEKSKSDPESYLVKKRYYDSLYDDLMIKHKEFTKQFINENPNSLANIFALYQNFGKSGQPLFDKFTDFDIFNFVDSCLTLYYPHTPAVIALNNDVTKIKDQLEYKKFSEQLIQIGRKMPEFSLQTIKNKKLILNQDFEDKSLAILFFAVWNKASLRECKQINELYKKYRYKGFQVIGISFDTSEDKLLSFIENNEIKFPIICDYKYWDSDYTKQFGVRSIPDIILINNEHFIENRNINTSELKTILEEWRRNNLF